MVGACQSVACSCRWVLAHEFHGNALFITYRSAGHSYCGRILARSYAALDLTSSPPTRIVILGPSHRKYSSRCFLTGCGVLETPIGNLTVDTEEVNRLRRASAGSAPDVPAGSEAAKRAAAARGLFESTYPQTVDEEEHCIEMHLPYLVRSLQRAGSDHLSRVRVIPIVVGSLRPSGHAALGSLLASYLREDPGARVIISTDFCHWGTRFGYDPYDPKAGYKAPHEYISALDQAGMRALSTLSADRFRAYLEKTENTICGRHALCALLEAVPLLPAAGVGGEPSESAEVGGDTGKDKGKGKGKGQGKGTKISLEWLGYSRSGDPETMRDSSVSYAAGVLLQSTGAGPSSGSATGDGGTAPATASAAMEGGADAGSRAVSAGAGAAAVRAAGGASPPMVDDDD